jgi:hypothetical protein
MSTLLTRDGRVPKNKWVVLSYSGGRPLSKHQFKSSAIDKALMKTYQTGNRYVVCEIMVAPSGKPFLAIAYDTRREADARR